MNREELKLSLVDLFSKEKPVPIEYSPELFDTFKKDFWASFKTSLENAVKNNHESFTVNRICINWWHTSGNKLYALYRDSPESARDEAYKWFSQGMCKELDEMQIPYELEDYYKPELKSFRFRIAKLREFSNVERLGALK